MYIELCSLKEKQTLAAFVNTLLSAISLPVLRSKSFDDSASQFNGQYACIHVSGHSVKFSTSGAQKCNVTAPKVHGLCKICGLG